jgi:hypothetical protein
MRTCQSLAEGRKGVTDYPNNRPGLDSTDCINQCLLLALTGYYSRARECPLLSEKQTFRAETNWPQFCEYTPLERLRANSIYGHTHFFWRGQRTKVRGCQGFVRRSGTTVPAISSSGGRGKYVVLHLHSTICTSPYADIAGTVSRLDDPHVGFTLFASGVAFNQIVSG